MTEFDERQRIYRAEFAEFGTKEQRSDAFAQIAALVTALARKETVSRFRAERYQEVRIAEQIADAQIALEKLAILEGIDADVEACVERRLDEIVGKVRKKRVRKYRRLREAVRKDEGKDPSTR